MQIRLMKSDEVETVAAIWHASGQQVYTFIDSWKTFTLEQACTAFRESIAVRCEVWVAEISDDIVGYMALNGSYLDRLYVSPDHQRQGVGTALLRHAMKHCDDGLELHTHQKNKPACTFYAKHEFVPVRYGVSPPPESEPDVEFHWRPVRSQP